MDSYNLTLESIELLTEQAYGYFSDNGAEHKEALKNKLTIEETLLQFRDAFDENTEVLYNESKLFSQLKVSLFISCDCFNPFESSGKPDDMLMDSLLASYSGEPTWKYKNLVNQVDFTLRKQIKLSLLNKILLGIMIGTMLGLLSRLLPGDMEVSLAENYIQPVSNAFIGIMCVMAVFLTFFAVSLGIVHAGDLSSINKIGKTMLGRIARIMCIITAVIIIVYIPAMNLKLGSIGSGVNFKTTFDLILQFIPSNPIKPLVDFNTAQIIIIGAMFGFTMLFLGNKTNNIENVFSECNLVAVTCNSFLNSNLIHIFVAINFFTLFATGNAATVLSSIRVVAIVLFAFLIVMLIYTLSVSRRLGIKPKHIVKKLMPTFIINISSASYGSSFTASIECMINNGVDVDYASLEHNIGGLLFKPGYAIFLAATAMNATIINGVEVSFDYLIMTFILSIVLAMSLPTIPQAAVSGLTLIFTQLALPEESLATAITINAIMDFFIVAFNGYCLQSEMLISAKKAGKLDLNKLLNN